MRHEFLEFDEDIGTVEGVRKFNQHVMQVCQDIARQIIMYQMSRIIPTVYIEQERGYDPMSSLLYMRIRVVYTLSNTSVSRI